MILCNTEVHKALDEKRLVIDPEPSPRLVSVTGGHCPYDTHTVDLRLSSEIVIPESNKFTYDMTRPGNLAQVIQTNSRSLKVTGETPYRLEPHKFILGKTIERVALPFHENCETCLAARIEGKSSFARLGLLVHFTAPTIHPGFEGTITLEIINLGPATILLSPNMYIAQLIIEEVKGCPGRNPSQFQGQQEAVGVLNAGRGNKGP